MDSFKSMATLMALAKFSGVRKQTNKNHEGGEGRLMEWEKEERVEYDNNQNALRTCMKFSNKLHSNKQQNEMKQVSGLWSCIVQATPNSLEYILTFNFNECRLSQLKTKTEAYEQN